MTVNDLLMCVYSVKDTMIIREVKHNCIYFANSPKMYEKSKLIDNYVRIINCETPKYYHELYESYDL